MWTCVQRSLSPHWHMLPDVSGLYPKNLLARTHFLKPDLILATPGRIQKEESWLVGMTTSRLSPDGEIQTNCSPQSEHSEYVPEWDIFASPTPSSLISTLNNPPPHQLKTFCKCCKKKKIYLCVKTCHLFFYFFYLLSISTIVLPRLQVTYKCFKWIWSSNSCERTPREPWNMCKDPWPLQ